jgi:hypothetical protein
MLSFEKISSACQDKFAAGANHGLKFRKRRQLFIRARNVPVSVVAVCVSNADHSYSLIPGRFGGNGLAA